MIGLQHRTSEVGGGRTVVPVGPMGSKSGASPRGWPSALTVWLVPSGITRTVAPSGAPSGAASSDSSMGAPSGMEKSRVDSESAGPAYNAPRYTEKRGIILNSACSTDVQE